MLTPAQIQQRRNAGLALKEKKGQEYYSEIGKLGGRPTFQQWLEAARERERAAKALSKPGRKLKKEDNSQPLA